MSKMKCLAGLDIGTTGCKITVFGMDGTYLGGVYRDYPALRSHSAHEVDGGAIWAAVREVLGKAAREYPGIAGIGVTSFGESFVLLDEKETPLLPTMLYTDPRGREECAELAQRLGKEKIIHTTGLNPAAMYSLPKLMWVKRHRPDEWKKARRVCQMQDYIVGRLTGNYQLDYSAATRTMTFDLQKFAWSEAMLDAAEMEEKLFSPLVPSGALAGAIRPEWASEWGLDADTRVISACHDQVAAAIGSGVLDDSATVDGAGTVECLTPVFRRYDAEKMAEGNYCIVPFLKGSFVTYAFSYTGGALVKWFTDQLAGYAAQQAREEGGSIYGILEGEADGIPTGILVQPHFAGAATPYMDPESKGAILGLQLSHTQSDLYRACMEGVCYEMRLNQERLSQAGIALSPLRATGGGAKSRVWMQMKADVLNLPVTRLGVSEAGAAGCAMLAGTAIGAFRDLKEAAGVMVREKETFLPRPDAHERYEGMYAQYKKIYRAVRPLV